MKECKTFEEYMEYVHKSINEQAEKLMGMVKNVYMEPAPLMSKKGHPSGRTYYP